jgi:hypothetical protein
MLKQTADTKANFSWATLILVFPLSTGWQLYPSCDWQTGSLPLHSPLLAPQAVQAHDVQNLPGDSSDGPAWLPVEQGRPSSTLIIDRAGAMLMIVNIASCLRNQIAATLAMRPS